MTREELRKDNEAIVQMVGIGKTFGAVKALSDVDLTINKGEVLGLVGDNGAGKSTIVKILSGVYQPDAGTVYFDGKPANWKSPRQARLSGVETVYQDLALIGLMSISREFFLGQEPIKQDRLSTLFGRLDSRKMSSEAARSLAEIGITSRKPNDTVGTLSGGEKQAIAIGRAMYFGAKLLILDEPTAALSVKETERVLELIRELRNKGLAIVYITHNIYHVYSVADRFAVLERGIKIADLRKDECTAQDIMNMVSGKTG
ncbi:MAG: sugar ABC transporter ATP-binding protein [Firmicutes bacterium]|jgi:simple sugar transport system ATP-binding protein|nr:sugar ABC transporter ATP-binding protein [Bacillota bacterium]